MPLSPFDHYVARIGRGRRDEGDAAGRPARRAGPHQFGAGPRLAESAPCEQQPDAPLARGRQLVGPRPETPIVQYRKCLIRSQRADQFIPRDLRQRGEPAGVQALHAHPPPDRLLGSPRDRRGAAGNMPMMPRDRVERGLLVVELESASTGPGARCDFADRGGLGIAEFVRRTSARCRPASMSGSAEYRQRRCGRILRACARR